MSAEMLVVGDSIAQMREEFVQNLGKLVFRRVGRVMTVQENLVQTIVEKVSSQTGETTVTYFKNGEAPTFSDQERLQNVEENYSKFYFFTTTTSLRGNDRWGPLGIYGAAEKYAEIDVTEKGTFRFLPLKKTMVPPRVGDLVCGLVSKVPGRINTAFKKWFICSEQFFHAWTSVMYEEHESLSKNFTDETQIRRHLMSGNRLATNSFRKKLLSCQQSAVELNVDELSKSFYRLRTEQTSRKWVHVYAALTLLLRYKEYPSPANIPNNLDKGPKMTSWDLPDGWLDTLVQKYGLVVSKGTPATEPQAPVPTETRVAIVVEEEKLSILDSSKIKDITGSDIASSRPLPSKNVLNVQDYNAFPVLSAPSKM